MIFILVLTVILDRHTDLLADNSLLNYYMRQTLMSKIEISNGIELGP